ESAVASCCLRGHYAFSPKLLPSGIRLESGILHWFLQQSFGSRDFPACAEAVEDVAGQCQAFGAVAGSAMCAVVLRPGAQRAGLFYLSLDLLKDSKTFGEAI